MVRNFFIAFAIMLSYSVIVNDLMDLLGAPADNIFRYKTKYSLYFLSAAFAIIVSIGRGKSKRESEQSS